MSVNYIRFSHDSEDRDNLIAQLVECYRKVFADDPWNEWLKCIACHQHWGIKDMAFVASCGYRHCGLSLVDFWPRVLVYDDIAKEVMQERSSCWLALDQATVIGFCWGYPITLKEFEKKIELTVDTELFELANPEEALLAHQDEVGVINEYRGKKIARDLVKLRNADFMSMGLQFGIVRTRESPQPSVTYLWYSRIGYKILAKYPGNDGRVIMGMALNKLSNVYEKD